MDKLTTKHIKEWKYWKDDVLDRVQRFYELDCGYNGECDHVWVPVKGDKYKLPAIENKFKYALVVASVKSGELQDTKQ